MINMSFQILDNNNPWYPHVSIMNNNVKYIMESATLELKSDIVEGTFIEIIDQS